MYCIANFGASVFFASTFRPPLLACFSGLDAALGDEEEEGVCAISSIFYKPHNREMLDYDVPVGWGGS